MHAEHRPAIDWRICLNNIGRFTHLSSNDKYSCSQFQFTNDRRVIKKALFGTPEKKKSQNIKKVVWLATLIALISKSPVQLVADTPSIMRWRSILLKPYKALTKSGNISKLIKNRNLKKVACRHLAGLYRVQSAPCV